MAGAGVRLFTAGSILTAVQVNTFLMDQVVARFADSGARDAAFGGLGEPVLSEGRFCYLDSDNKLYLYTGSVWEEVGGQVVDGGITTVKLADGAVTAIKIAADAVTTVKILDANVTNAKLATMATKTYKGRTSAATGVSEDVAVATLKTDLTLDNVDNTSNATERAAAATLTNKTLVAPVLGTPASGNLANTTGYPAGDGNLVLSSQIFA